MKTTTGAGFWMMTPLLPFGRHDFSERVFVCDECDHAKLPLYLARSRYGGSLLVCTPCRLTRNVQFFVDPGEMGPWNRPD